MRDGFRERGVGVTRRGHVTTGVYVTGTDTGVGKTVAAATLVHALRGRGLRVAGMKPVASGSEATAQGWRNDDALALIAASGSDLPYPDVNPYALQRPTAPEIAARLEHVEVELSVLLAAHSRLAAVHEFVIVEGVGGWEAPLAANLLQAQLCLALALPVVLVVGLRLGCLNHARLSQRAIAADGLRCVGWIGSAIDPQLEYPQETVALLRRDLAAPCLGVLPHAQEPDPASMAAQLELTALLS